MKESPIFLSVEQVLAVHSRMIEEFGGDAAVRHRGLLESAVHIPAAQYGGEYLHESMPPMAGAYLFHLWTNHPFVDGNKRTALASAEIFLLVNGMVLDAGDEQLEKLTLGIARGRISKDETVAFLEDHVTDDG